MAFSRKFQVSRVPAPIAPKETNVVPQVLTAKVRLTNKDGSITEVSLYREPPPLPSEMTGYRHAATWWVSYWQILIDSGQASPTFVPTILTMCMMRQTFHTVTEKLLNPSFIASKPAKGLLTIQNQVARNLTALESSFGMTLNTSNLRTINVTPSKNEKPKSTNTIADRSTPDNPYEDPSGEVLFGDDQQ